MNDTSHPLKNSRVFVSGNFFLLHPGHIRFLNFAAELGDELVIGVDPKIPTADLPSVEERIDALSSLGIASQVISIGDSLEATIRMLRPSIVVKGKEYAGLVNIEEKLLMQWGGKVVFSSGESNYFEDNLLISLKEKSNRAIVRADDFLKRHRCDIRSLEQIIESFSTLNILIIGDTIIDEYVECEVLGMSREDPTIVVSPRKTKRYLGGAGIVAAHASALGASVSFVSLVGNDEAGAYARSRLVESKVDPIILKDDSRPTSLKVRYRADSRTMFRVSHLRQHEASPKLQSEMIEVARPLIAKSDIVVFSDFNYGTLPTAVVSSLLQTAKSTGAFVAADSQSSSQVGDITRFRGADLVTPTEFEARLALRDQLSGLSFIGPSLLERMGTKKAIITLGKSGLLAIEANPKALGGFRSDSLPALNRAPKDVAGAGDSLLMVSAMSMKLGGSLFDGAFLGSLAAAIQTSRVGNTPISRAELLTWLHSYASEVELT